MSSEAALWDWLRGVLPPRGHYSRIESETSPGFPDLDYCLDGYEGTIELKCSRKPLAKYPFKIGGLRNSQKIWIRTRLRAGGVVWILAQVGRERFLLQGNQWKYFNSHTLESLRLAVICEEVDREGLEYFLTNGHRK